MTLREHAVRLDEKLGKLERAAAETDAELDSRLDVQDGGGAALGAQLGPTGVEPKLTGERTLKVRQNLVLPRWEPPVSGDLDQWDRNLAGQRLLPNLEPFDWPDAKELSAGQEALPAQVKARLKLVESCVPGVRLYTTADGRIVLPQQAEALKARICAVAHQGRHGHLPHEVSADVMQRYFQWPGLRKDAKKWMDYCLQCIK